MALTTYQTQTTDLLHDSSNQFYPSALVTRAINLARKEIAKRARCVRVVPTPGTGVNQLATVNAQETYTFASVNPLVQLTAGVSKINSVCQVAVSWGSYIPALKYYPWNLFNAWFRAINQSGFQGFSAAWSQYGDAANGVVYLFPIPTQANAMLWDCSCLPVDLVDDSTAEAIPDPYTDAIKYWAAAYCYLNSQRRQDYLAMMKDYNNAMALASSSDQPWMVPDWYSIGYR